MSWLQCKFVLVARLYLISSLLEYPYCDISLSINIIWMTSDILPNSEWTNWTYLIYQNIWTVGSFKNEYTLLFRVVVYLCVRIIPVCVCLLSQCEVFCDVCLPCSIVGIIPCEELAWSGTSIIRSSSMIWRFTSMPTPVSHRMVRSSWESSAWTTSSCWKILESDGVRWLSLWHHHLPRKSSWRSVHHGCAPAYSLGLVSVQILMELE